MMRANMRNPGIVRLDVAFFLILLPALLGAEDARPTANTAPPTGVVSYLNLYVKVQLDRKVKLSALKPGEVVEGKLSRSVYAQDKQLFPAGSRVRLTVDKLAQRRRAPNDHWPWVIKAFTPRQEKVPTFQSAQVLLADGEEVSLRVSLVSLGHEVEVQAETKKENRGKLPESSRTTHADRAARSAAAPQKTTKDHHPPPASLTANFEAVVLKGEGLSESPRGPSSASSGQMLTVAAGTPAKVVLLDGLSASKSRPGDSFQARLVEPVYSGSTVVLPEGSVFEGQVVKSTAPRLLRRSGSVLLSFTAVTRPRGTTEPMAASVTGVRLHQRSHTRVDPEGQLKGERPGKAWLAMNLGVTGGIAKVVDDGAQLLIEAIVSSATDVSTAGTGRLVAVCASGLFMLTRHGRDVVLPKFTEMDLSFNRPVSLATTPPVPLATEKRGQTQLSKMEK